jgi:hypothetical protein
VSRLRRRKPTLAELRVDQLRQARLAAPTLRALQPAAAWVSVKLAFDVDGAMAQAPRSFTVFPPAQAHFIYACAYGDCDGTHDLGEEIRCLLRAGASGGTGVRHCSGRRAHRGGGLGPRCTLRLTYLVTVQYVAERAAAPMQPAVT